MGLVRGKAPGGKRGRGWEKGWKGVEGGKGVGERGRKRGGREGYGKKRNERNAMQIVLDIPGTD